MKKTILGISAVLSIGVFSAPSFGGEQPLPNIITILVDDMGWQDIACYYDALHSEPGLYETPNIDRIAGQGIRFMQAYSPSPTCSPSRAAYLSGQFGVKNGESASQKTLVIAL